MMKPMEEETTPKAPNTSSSSPSSNPHKPIIPRPPQKEKPLNCPRCSSSNTKFCYYNNYSLTQPRYFCKACKRYWTQGGALRSIPVGGRSRKANKRSYSTTCSSTKMIKHLPDLVDHHNQSSSNIYNMCTTNPNPKLVQDLNLGCFTSSSSLLQLSNNFLNDPYNDYKNALFINQQTLDASYSSSNNVSPSYISAVQLLTGMASSRAPFMPYPNNPVYPVGFSLQGDLRPSLIQGVDGRVLFPFENLRSTPTTATTTTTTAAETIATNEEHDHHQGQDPTGYWSGNINLGGAGTW